MTGLAHLEGRDVMALADGATQGPFTVAGGAITLSQPAVIATVGLSVHLGHGALGHHARSGADEREGVPKVTLEVVASRGVLAGETRLHSLKPWRTREAPDAFGNPPLVTDQIDVRISTPGTRAAGVHSPGRSASARRSPLRAESSRSAVGADAPPRRSDLPPRAACRMEAARGTHSGRGGTQGLRLDAQLRRSGHLLLGGRVGRYCHRLRRWWRRWLTGRDQWQRPDQLCGRVRGVHRHDMRLCREEPRRERGSDLHRSADHSDARGHGVRAADPGERDGVRRLHGHRGVRCGVVYDRAGRLRTPTISRARYVTTQAEAGLSAEAVLPTCTGTDKLTFNGTTISCAVDQTGAGGGGAPTTATYITQTADATLTGEQALSSLGTGLLKNTTGTGVLSIGRAARTMRQLRAAPPS
jgi:hypothetical protein